MVTSNPDIFEILEEVKDPEIPTVSIVDLGIVRGVRFEGGSVVIDITPTYSGCPAMKVIEEEIYSALHSKGFETVKVNLIYSPPWTTDWLSEKGKAALKSAGIAPPGKSTDLVQIAPFQKASPVECPHCGSLQTELRSSFGPTACKALHYCNACRQPFEHFKEF